MEKEQGRPYLAGGAFGGIKTYTYQELHREVCKFANVLKKFGVKKGDRVTIYLPMIPELPIALLACARIGAIHSVVFRWLQRGCLERQDSGLRIRHAYHRNHGYRSGKVLPSKKNADAAMDRVRM